MRRSWLCAGGVGLALVLAVVAPLAGAPKKGSTVTVKVLSAQVMKKPAFVGASVAKVSRGEHLIFQAEQKGWYQVALASGAPGWIHGSAVQAGELKLSSRPGGRAGGGASQDEVELAGRGFTPQVEEEYRTSHADLDFGHVDRIEALVVDTEALADFAAKGQVGGAP